MSKTATILALAADDLRNGSIGYNFGARVVSKLYQDFPQVWCGPRQQLETNDNFVQPIPYVVVSHTLMGEKRFLVYRRGVECNEERLRGSLAIGVGGHVDAEDSRFHDDGSIDFWATLWVAAYREVAEEIGIAEDTVGILNQVGWIHESESAVGAVHLGVVMEWDATSFLKAGGKFTFEEGLDQPEFLTKEYILTATDASIETWTGLALELF